MANLDDVYMGTAFLHARKSKAIRAQVGAVIVTRTGVLIPGYNGTPAGTDNACEDQVWEENYGPGGDNGEYVLKTKETVIHAELNALIKAAKEGIAIDGAKVYITHSPCLPCAAMLKQAGIAEVIYAQVYKSQTGINFLTSCSVSTQLLEIDPNLL